MNLIVGLPNPVTCSGQLGYSRERKEVDSPIPTILKEVTLSDGHGSVFEGLRNSRRAVSGPICAAANHHCWRIGAGMPFLAGLDAPYDLWSPAHRVLKMDAGQVCATGGKGGPYEEANLRSAVSPTWRQRVVLGRVGLHTAKGVVRRHDEGCHGSGRSCSVCWRTGQPMQVTSLGSAPVDGSSREPAGSFERYATEARAKNAESCLTSAR